MNVLLVNPQGSNWMKGSSYRTTSAVRMAPMGLLSIAAYLLRLGHRVQLLDLSAVEPERIEQEFAAELDGFRPDLVGFTTVTSSFPNANALAELVKERLPSARTVFGGVHVSALRGAILERYPAIDLVVNGEGEQAMAELAAGADYGSIEGLIYREGGEVRDNGIRRTLCTLDELPLPAYHLLKGFPRQYEGPLFSSPRIPTATMVSSRGCPYECSYCDRSVFRNSYRYNSAEYLYEHMAHLRHNFGIRHIYFADDLFTFHRKRIESLCDMLRQKPLGMTFNCAVRVGHADDELLRMLKGAGCWTVTIGVESGSPELLARHKCSITLEEMKETVLRIKKSGLRTKGLFMMGLPGETEETIRQTAAFIEELELDDMNMTKFTPFPGSPLYRTIHEEGSFTEEWELMNCMNFVFVPKGIESAERIEGIYRDFVRGFYTSKNFTRKVPWLLIQSPDNLKRLLRNLPQFLRVRKEFSGK